MNVYADLVEWGFVGLQAGTLHGDWDFVNAPELAAAPVQFGHVRFAGTDTAPRVDVHIIHAGAQRIDAERVVLACDALRRERAARTIAIVGREADGRAEAQAVDAPSLDVVAAAVSIVKASGGWDESEVFVVVVDGVAVKVGLQYVDDAWGATTSVDP